MTTASAGAWMPPAPAPKKRARPGRIVFWVLFGLAVACFLGAVAGARATAVAYSMPSTSMLNTVRPGDEVFVQRGQDVHRGDVVVINIPPGGNVGAGAYVKRVIGLPGDRVACCNAQGEVTVNRIGINESTYLYPGDKPSNSPFSVTLKPGTVWLMGDHRAIALDSRAWGPIPASDIVGRVVVIKPVSGRTTIVWTPRQFVDDDLAPASGTGIPSLVVLLLAAVAAFLAVIVLGIFGTVRWSIRRSRARRKASGPPVPGQYVA